MKLNNRLGGYALAGVAALWLAGAAAAADGAMPSCCAAAAAQPMADEAKPDAKVTPDLLATCPVSGDKLGEMGKPMVFTYKDQEVKLCCKSCKKDFDKNPDKYMAMIRAADKK
jgi:YHS domain-containing protein